MAKKVLDETKRLVVELFDSGLSVAGVATRARVSYSTAYASTRARRRGFASKVEYEEHLAKRRGFASKVEYEKYLAKRRQQQPMNQNLSRLIKERLQELGRTQKWLAEQLGITEGAVSRYISGKTTPTKSLQARLIVVLQWKSDS